MVRGHQATGRNQTQCVLGRRELGEELRVPHPLRRTGAPLLLQGTQEESRGRTTVLMQLLLLCRRRCPRSIGPCHSPRVPGGHAQPRATPWSPPCLMQTLLPVKALMDLFLPKNAACGEEAEEGGI